MQTLRKRNSPCKYKNEPARFLGDGMTFKAKLIGILEVNEARGDKMCQDALNDLKTAIRAAGEHKQRITISIAIDGLRLRDEKTGDCMYHHPVHKISFIAQDMSDSRAFGYIFGSPDTGHRFFGIKTDKTASQVVIAMRDLFQVVFELKKREIEMTKRHIELHQSHFGRTSAAEGTKDDVDEKVKIKSVDHNKSLSSLQSARETSSHSSKDNAGRNSEAIADLLDLEDELNSIQQGISQMDRITPSDPFGPLSSKADSFLDSFKEKATNVTKPCALSYRSASQSSNKEHSDSEKSASIFESTASSSSRPVLFSQYSPTTSKEEKHWFHHETESLFTDGTTRQLPDTSTSPLTFHTPTGDPEQPLEEQRSPLKTDLFTDLDPLGTGKVKPYLDKKDFFQELKNPPKKVLKELISEPCKHETNHYFQADFATHKKEPPSSVSSVLEPSVIKNPIANTSNKAIASISEHPSRFSKVDPFADMDPFEKTDPFLEDSFPKSIGFPSLMSAKASVDVLQERVTFHQEKESKRSRTPENQVESPKSSIFSSSIHGPLRVSLPPEKPDTNTTISLSSFASRFRSSPSPTEDSKAPRRKHYQALKQSHDDKSDDQSNSPILEEVYMRASPKPFSINSFESKKILIGSPPPVRSNKVRTKMSSSLEILDSTPDPPPRPKTTLFAIKPPPLPPKKQNQPTFRPPARPPSLEENVHYDYLRQKIEPSPPITKTDTINSPKKTSSSNPESSRQNSIENFTKFPILPPPPQRKSSIDTSRTNYVTTPTSAPISTAESKEPSVLNITLNQLDQSGFESLASTLGIPTENVCNLTLQELTKMLAQKYLAKNDEKAETESAEKSSFHADFDSNFSNAAVASSESPGFDKYAVFKELIDGQDLFHYKNGKDDVFDESNNSHADVDVLSSSERKMSTTEGEEGDKYAALRQLSIYGQKTQNLSEDLDISNEDDSSAMADNVSDIVKVQMEETPLSSKTTSTNTQYIKPDENEETDIKEEVSKKVTGWEESSLEKDHQETNPHPIIKAKQNPIFESPGSENWATFDKEEIRKTVDDDRSNDIEMSPISSDGKDEHKKPSSWQKTIHKGRDFPWKDEDDSCDDFSAKESYWSDESSHDGQSPVKENLSPYQRKAWNRHVRSGWANAPPQWHRRWLDDTEDEYDNNRRRRRPHSNTFDRNKEVEYGGHSTWGWEAWENDRFSRNYVDRHKSRGEYTRGCDSDASDRECINWERNYQEPTGTKQKQFYGRSKETIERHWSDNRESRSRFKRSSAHKRPSSASDAKRYEKMYSTVDHCQRSLEKRESEDEQYLPRFRPSRKDLRYHSNIEHYGSYDRRAQATYQRRMQRGRRLKDIEAGSLNSETCHFLTPETPRSSQSQDTPGSTRELHFKFEDDFIPSSNASPVDTSKVTSESPGERKLQGIDWGSTMKVASDNNGQYATFNDELPDDRGSKGGVGTAIRKPSLKGRSHLAKMGRQDSTTSLRKSESINIFSRESDPFEDDDFFSGNNAADGKLNRYFPEKSRSNTNVSDPFAWKEMFEDCKFGD